MNTKTETRRAPVSDRDAVAVLTRSGAAVELTAEVLAAFAERLEGRIVLPDEGALLLPYVIVAPKGVADRDMVAKWLNYIASAAPQERGVALSGYIPGNNNAKATDEIVRKLGMPFDELRAKLYQPDWDFIARHQKERVDAIEKMMAEL